MGWAILGADGVTVVAADSTPKALRVILYDASGNPVVTGGTVAVSGTVTAGQGTPNTPANAWPVEVTDGTNVLGTSAHPVRTDPTGTTTQPISGTVGQGTAAALAGAWPVEVTDGSHTLPTMDAAARKAFMALTDGTSVAAVKAGSTAAAAGDPAAVVSLSPNSPLPGGTNAIGTVAQGNGSGAAGTYWYVRVTDGTNAMPTMDVAARAGFQQLTDGTHGPAAVKAASTAAVAADPALVVALSPSSPAFVNPGVAWPDREEFGAQIVASRATEITVDWSQAAPPNAVSVVTSGGASSAQANGQFTLTSGSAVTAAASAQTIQKSRYQPGREIYAVFTAAFTTPTSTATNQRAGLYDANNGFYIGYENALTFGITKRNLAANTTVAQSSFNVDTLTGGATSLFTSGGTPVALDPTKLNVYRIRFGWLGAATISFQVLSPDGNWVTFHRILAPNSQVAPSIANPTLPMTMEVNKAAADATSLVLSTSSWESGAVGSNSMVSGSAVAASGSVAGAPILGIDGGQIARAARVGEYGTQRVTSEVLLWHDAFEGSTINAFWTQSLTTMTLAQATGVLSLNSGGITTLNTNAIITSQRQFSKYPRQPLYCRFKANITANAAANHTLAELGFGAPVGTTAVVSNGAFFRWTAAGNLVAVLSYNGTETVSGTLISQGQSSFSTSSYYYYDIIIDDDFARFIVSDSNGIPIVDFQMSLSTTTPFTLAVSHIPSFARVYTDATGGGTAIQLKISAHTVQMLDAANELTWPEQSALAMRSGLISPTAYTATAGAMNAAPATLTPANATTGFATLGGEYAFAGITALETGAPIFSFQVPTPYSLVLQGIQIPAPMVTTAMSLTGVPFIEWFVCINATTNLLSTGGGMRMPLGIQHTTSIAPAIGTVWTTTGTGLWQPKTPLVVLPGLWIHIGFKWLVTSAAGTPGVNRGTVSVDGYFM